MRLSLCCLWILTLGRLSQGAGAEPGVQVFMPGFESRVLPVKVRKSDKLAVGPAGMFLASTSMMVADAAISPACHLHLTAESDEPDQGNGPEGKGKIFKVVYAEAQGPRAVVAWPSGPLEARVAFDRPVDPAILAGLVGRTLTFGELGQPADRLEALKPRDKAVQPQQAATRGTLRIAAARLDDDGRTLVLATDPHPTPATYSLTLPSVKPAGRPGSGATVHLVYDLSGAAAAWQAGRDDAKPAWSGWWPHLDTDAVRKLTAGSAEHDRALALLGQPGRLTMTTMVELPTGQAKVTIEATGPIEVSLAGENVPSGADPKGVYRAAATTESTGEAVELSVTATTGGAGKPLVLHASYHTEADPTERPLPIGRLQVPWAPARPPTSTTPVEVPAALVGGDRARGEAVFYSDQARCSACHKVRGKGGEIGPDLSNLARPDIASVYRDIHDPSVTINPNYVAYAVALKDGRVAQGIVRAEGADAIRVLDTEAKETVIRRSEIEELRPTSSSIMPAGLIGVLGDEKLRDLLAFLTAPPKEGEEKPKVGAENRR